MTSTETQSFETVADARAFAVEKAGPFLVIAPETLDAIVAAEAAGGFEGGMSGSSGDGGYSAPGNEGEVSSSASDPAPIVLEDLDGAVNVGAFLEEGTETILDLNDIIEAFKGVTSPVLLVPREELRRWLGVGTPDDA
ncbi:hypothetical protein [Occultella kanbiaonis]|uniref:hypothetical protein n=1 Tax=Occultella kanbiaonis TaxID=2675754 RepID=UPI0013D2666B|nr:hypothetical protein [Occultella kanbiaonis]